MSLKTAFSTCTLRATKLICSQRIWSEHDNVILLHVVVVVVVVVVAVVVVVVVVVVVLLLLLLFLLLLLIAVVVAQPPIEHHLPLNHTQDGVQASHRSMSHRVPWHGDLVVLVQDGTALIQKSLLTRSPVDVRVHLCLKTSYLDLTHNNHAGMIFMRGRAVSSSCVVIQVSCGVVPARDGHAHVPWSHAHP
jgi:hypothetical protein